MSYITFIPKTQTDAIQFKALMEVSGYCPRWHFTDSRFSFEETKHIMNLYYRIMDIIDSYNIKYYIKKSRSKIEGIIRVDKGTDFRPISSEIAMNDRLIMRLIKKHYRLPLKRKRIKKLINLIQWN